VLAFRPVVDLIPGPPQRPKSRALPPVTRVGRGSTLVIALGLLAAGAANVAFLALEPFDGMIGSDAVWRIAATGAAGASALSAGWIAERVAARLLLTVAAILLLLLGGITPVLAVGAPILLALLTAVARDLAIVTADLPAVRIRLLLFAAVGLGGPPLVALAHLFA
jgi:hypothetical protein